MCINPTVNIVLITDESNWCLSIHGNWGLCGPAFACNIISFVKPKAWYVLGVESLVFPFLFSSD